MAELRNSRALVCVMLCLPFAVCCCQLLQDFLVHHEVTGLDQDCSRVILRRQHRMSEKALEDLKLLDVEDALLQACSGMPLALEIIGGALNPGREQKPANIVKRWQVCILLAVQAKLPTAGCFQGFFLMVRPPDNRC